MLPPVQALTVLAASALLGTTTDVPTTAAAARITAAKTAVACLKITPSVPPLANLCIVSQYGFRGKRVRTSAVTPADLSSFFYGSYEGRSGEHKSVLPSRQ